MELRTIVENVKNYNKRIVVVTGSAGGREKEKRSKIGSYLLDNANFVVYSQWMILDMKMLMISLMIC